MGGAARQCDITRPKLRPPPPHTALHTNGGSPRAGAVAAYRRRWPLPTSSAGRNSSSLAQAARAGCRAQTAQFGEPTGARSAAVSCVAASSSATRTRVRWGKTPGNTAGGTRAPCPCPRTAGRFAGPSAGLRTMATSSHSACARRIYSRMNSQRRVAHAPTLSRTRMPPFSPKGRRCGRTKIVK